MLEDASMSSMIGLSTNLSVSTFSEHIAAEIPSKRKGMESSIMLR